MSSADRDGGTRPLSREAIVEAAVAVADAEGLDALSMRRVADEVGAAPMSLYTHVQDKDDLLAGMVEQVVGEVALPPDDVGWRRAARTIACELRAALEAHPWACRLWGSAWPGPNRTRMMEEILGAFRRGGFSRRVAHHALHALDLYVVGFVEQSTSFAIGLVDPEAAVARFIAQTPREQFPWTHEHVEHHLDEDAAEDDFGFMLALVLDGLERHRDED